MKKWICAAMAVLLLPLLGGCGQKEPAQPEAMKEITIGLMPDLDSIPFIIAQEKGYFAEEHLTVNIQSFKSAMDRDSALQSGNLDGAVSDLLAVAFAKNGGFDVKVTSSTNGSYRLVAGKENAAVSVQELKGQEVAISKNTIIEYVTDRILAENAMREADIQKVVIPQIPTRLEMLQNGKLAAATLPEPMASIALTKGGRLIHSSDRLGINPGVMMFTGKSASEKAKEIKAMYRAYNRAVAYLATEPRETYIDLLIEKAGFPAAAKDALELPKYRKAEVPVEKDVTECMVWMKDKGLIPQAYTYADLVDGSLVQ